MSTFLSRNWMINQVPLYLFSGSTAENKMQKIWLKEYGNTFLLMVSFMHHKPCLWSYSYWHKFQMPNKTLKMTHLLQKPIVLSSIDEQ